MHLRDLVPWGHRGEVNRDSPFTVLQHQVNQLFDSFVKGLPDAGLGGLDKFQPSVDISETDSTVLVTAELPGMSEADVELTVSPSGDALILKGEKRTETEEGEEGTSFHRIERSYGSFRRTVALPSHVEHDGAEALFENGVLSVTLRKSPEPAEDPRRIYVDVR